jgi:hypothetical protein
MERPKAHAGVGGDLVTRRAAKPHRACVDLRLEVACNIFSINSPFSIGICRSIAVDVCGEVQESVCTAFGAGVMRNTYESNAGETPGTPMPFQ